MKSAVLVFPGINRERDMARALKLASGKEAAMAAGAYGGSYLLRITVGGTKTVIFSKAVTLNDNADWLLTVIPDEGVGAVTPNDVRVLLVRGDDQDSLPATELLTD